jgi:hypothetical protein
LKNSENRPIMKTTIDCPVREQINSFCSCPKIDCNNHGICCECILDHKNRDGVEIIKRFPHCLRNLVREAMENDS